MMTSEIAWEGDWLPADRAGFVPEDTEESVASFSLGIRMHCKKAALFQRPRAWIVESSTPSRTAEVAAPIWKLASIEVLWLACHVENATNFRYELALKNCPGLSPRMVITQNCSNWPEDGPSTTHNNVWPRPKLVALWLLYIDLRVFNRYIPPS